VGWKLNDSPISLALHNLACDTLDEMSSPDSFMMKAKNVLNPDFFLW
jgi:hypothetical protein